MEDNWFFTGFPDNSEINASDSQKRYLKGMREKLRLVVDESERVLIEFMGFDNWLNRISLYRASYLIKLLKACENSKETTKEQLKKIKKQLDNKHKIGDKCVKCKVYTVCNTDGDYVCPCCGKNLINVRTV